MGLITHKMYGFYSHWGWVETILQFLLYIIDAMQNLMALGEFLELIYLVTLWPQKGKKKQRLIVSGGIYRMERSARMCSSRTETSVHITCCRRLYSYRLRKDTLILKLIHPIDNSAG